MVFVINKEIDKQFTGILLNWKNILKLVKKKKTTEHAREEKNTEF